MKLKLLAASALVALGATSAQAASFSTFDGGEHGDFQTGVRTQVSGPFFTDYDFTLDGTYSLTATFASSKIIGSFGLYNAADDTPIYSWGVGGATFTTSSMFTLGAGSYYYAVLGTGSTGNYTLTSTAVAAVPEPETYALLAAGLGIVGFVASRRRRDF